MFEIRDTIMIQAPIERVFALSTNVAIVQLTLGMKPVDAPESIVANSRVHWRGWKFGMPTEHHTLITGYKAPHPSGDWMKAFFQDSQAQGRFAHFHHDHFFTQHKREASTVLEDRVHFSLAWWMGSKLAERFLLAPYIRRLLWTRFALLKQLAEGEGWREYIAG
ncbi:hypothetical protein ACFQBQ_10435 [Granulicella cerasi]|uniref:Ligand-binding SRPBCC domain-containing protein n=1 Tax=Granulicella cerasi TaxID=741063 RepID=A0ABW1Z948_9BACT|nr:hypothetical protein [Granulicella cerasi]